MWDVVIDDYKLGYSATSAPLIVKDKVVVGIAGAEYGIRGFIDAYDAATGKRAWRFWTVPGPGEKGNETWEGDSWKRGGGSTWVTGSYDPALNLIYWGTGNPGPDLYGKDREGDNLYTDSVVALDADTGVIKWHYQFTPHDTHDWDATRSAGAGRHRRSTACARKVLLFANRNGFYYTLDRTNGAAADVAAVRQDHLGREDRPRRPPGRAAQHRSDRSRAPRSVPTSPAAPTSCRRPTTRRPACST